jgi:hypothetical protein
MGNLSSLCGSAWGVSIGTPKDLQRRGKGGVKEPQGDQFRTTGVFRSADVGDF